MHPWAGVDALQAAAGDEGGLTARMLVRTLLRCGVSRVSNVFQKRSFVTFRNVVTMRSSFSSSGFFIPARPALSKPNRGAQHGTQHGTQHGRACEGPHAQARGGCLGASPRGSGRAARMRVMHAYAPGTPAWRGPR